MSRTGRIIVLIVAAVFLIAAVIAVVPGDSPSKLPAILIITVLGVAAALIQLAQTNFLQGIWNAPPANVKKGTAQQFLTHLADRHQLVRAEAAGHQPIYQLDTDYWTNLELDFSRIAEDNDSLDFFASRILREVNLRQDSIRILEPLDIGQSASDVRRVLDSIRGRISRHDFIRAANIHKHKDVVLLAGSYTTGIRHFLLQEQDHIASAVFLVGPDSRYLAAKLRGLRFRSISLVSFEALRDLDQGTRRAMTWYL